jgi:hypothetical protein
MASRGVNKRDLSWLTGTPVGDVNFTEALKRASAETIQAALDQLGEEPGTTTKKKTLEARLRKLSKERVDQASEAAIEMIEMERKQAEIVRNEQADRERRVAESHQLIGRIQGAKMVADFGNVAGFKWLREVHDLKLYRDMPGIGTWEKFCEFVGMSRKKIEDGIANLEAFGEEFLATVAGFRVGHRDLRKLRQLTHEGALQVEDGILVIGDETIPLDADHREDLQAALERVIDAKDDVLREKDAVIRSNEKLLQSKTDLIRRQEKDLARYEDTAARKGLTPDEDAFIQKCTNARITIDGFFMQFDPERHPLPEDASGRMKASLMETLRYFKRVTHAAYDTAGDIYGDAEMDSPGWIQPNLRGVDGED